LLALLNLTQHDDEPRPHKSNDSQDRYKLSQQKVNQGNRHHEMTRFLGHLLGQGTDPEIALLAFESYAKKFFDHPKDWLPKGSRYTEVTDFIQYKLTDIKEKEKIEITHKNDNLVKKTTNKFDLSDDFYLSAPDLIGEITREITQKAIYPLPALAFAQALAATGTIKSFNHVTNLGHPPANYFLCLAPTGGGKSYPQQTIAQTFSALSLQDHMLEGVSSAKGIYRFLQENSYLGLLQLDESDIIFQTLQDEKAPHYLKSAKDLLLQIYSAHDSPHKKIGMTGDRREAPIILKYPKMNVIAYGVNSLIDTAFNKKMITDGLVQRFIIISTENKRIFNKESIPPEPLNGQVYTHINKLVLGTKHYTETMMVQLQSLHTQYNAETDEAKKDKIHNELLKLEQKTMLKERKIINFTSQAEKLYKKYITDKDNQVNQENKKETGLAGLYTRDAEKVGRILAVMCDKTITPAHLEFAITFINSRTEAMKQACEENYNRPQIAKDVDDLQRCIAQNSDSNGWCTYRVISRGFRIRDSRALRQLLGEAIDSNSLKNNPQYSASKDERGRKGNAYAVDEID